MCKNLERGILLSSLLLLSVMAGAGLPAKPASGVIEQAFAMLEEKGEVVILFDCDDVSMVKRINDIISVDRRTSEGFEAYANADGFRAFLEFNIPFSLAERIPREKSTDNTLDFPGNWDVYPTHPQYVDFMTGIAVSHPDLCRLDTIGLSAEGRPILALKITDRPSEREAEPVFVYSSTMHGDETAGFMTLLRLIEYLCTGYGNDSLVSRLADNLEIWINPLANPDGTYWQGDDVIISPKRFNSNNVDLNRNFPGLNGSDHPDNEPYQPENIAQMGFLGKIPMVLGANIHGGAEVINYPFDSWELLHADDAWYRITSREYADQARQRAFPLLYMTSLDSGITNGWEWYQVEGSRQDWVNYFNHAREVTLEISLDKHPPPEDLPYYWHYNYPSLLRYMEQSLFGIHGVVKDKQGGKPLKASIRIMGHDKLNSEIYSDSLTGYFARLLEPGTWDLEISAGDFETALIEGIQVEANQVTWLDVSLMTRPDGFAETQDVRIFPNPFIDRADIYIPVAAPGPYSILLFDMKGRMVHRAALLCPEKGNYIYSLEGSDLEQGIYLLEIISPADCRTGKIFKSQ